MNRNKYGHKLRSEIRHREGSSTRKSPIIGLAAVCLICLLMAASNVQAVGSGSQKGNAPGDGLSATLLPLRINSDFDMEFYDFTYGWIGDGTPNNPYIIDGNDSVFDAHGIGAAIFIGNATIPITKSFIVTGWTILNCSSASPQDIFNPGAGLVLYNCNGTINITGNHFSFSN